MRRLFVGLLGAALALGITASAVTASDPVTFTIHNATLFAKGAAVDVTFDIVCDGNDASVDFGYVGVTQRINGHTLTYASDQGWTYDTYANPLICDGITPNVFSGHVVPTETGVPFKHGIAMVDVYAYFGEFGAQSYAVEMKLN